jgi:segregation and condensation protein A
MAVQGRRFARRVPMEPRFASLLPEVLLGIGPVQFAAIAAAALAPRIPPVVSTAHLHTPRTTVREQAAIMAARLREVGRASFRELSADCEDTYEIVARFLAVLDLYRDAQVSFDQESPLGDLFISWIGPVDDGGVVTESREASTVTESREASTVTESCHEAW